MQNERSKKYQEYIDSFDWYLRKRVAIARAGNMCERCKVVGIGLEVHHLTYERFGDERQEDLKVVCPPCHKKEDAERRYRMDNTRWYRRLNSWASKVYGKNWSEYKIRELVEQEFIDWLEQRKRENDGY